MTERLCQKLRNLLVEFCIDILMKNEMFTYIGVDPGGPVVIILGSVSEVHGFEPARGRWIFSERKNPEYDLLRKGSKAVGPVS